MTCSYSYIGSELELFSEARVWKSYLRRTLEPFLGRAVLEVGAGIGGTTKFLCRGNESNWVCLEPDAGLASELSRALEDGVLPSCCRIVVGTLEEEGAGLPLFDTILYIDVLEHIENDRAEMERAMAKLAPGGRVIALCPAHPWLYTPFDRAIGHYRRYTKAMFRALTPDGLELERLVYLDSVGLLSSLGNRLLLNQSQPTSAQIRVWDRYMVRLSRGIDPLLGYRAGKSVLGVWRGNS